jgi:hypothetical protein
MALNASLRHLVFLRECQEVQSITSESFIEVMQSLDVLDVPISRSCNRDRLKECRNFTSFECHWRFEASCDRSCAYLKQSSRSSSLENKECEHKRHNK